MAGTAHLQGLTRWPGKPTSGRFVFKGGENWFWQCDLCDAYETDYPTMPLAFEGCLHHASNCIDRPIRYEEN